MNIIALVKTFFQRRKIARLQSENASLTAKIENARSLLDDSPLKNQSIGQLRKLARRNPFMAGACQAELSRRLYQGKLKLSREPRERATGPVALPSKGLA